ADVLLGFECRRRDEVFLRHLFWVAAERLVGDVEEPAYLDVLRVAREHPLEALDGVLAPGLDGVLTGGRDRKDAHTRGVVRCTILELAAPHPRDAARLLG